MRYPHELVRVVKETVLRSVDASREGSIPSARIQTQSQTFYTDDRVVKVTVSRSVDASLMGSNPIPCTRPFSSVVEHPLCRKQNSLFAVIPEQCCVLGNNERFAVHNQR